MHSYTCAVEIFVAHGSALTFAHRQGLRSATVAKSVRSDAKSQTVIDLYDALTVPFLRPSHPSPLAMRGR